MNEQRPLALVTGASTGIGYELAKCCAQAGFDLVVVANESRIHEASEEFRQLGVEALSVEADLSTPEGVDEVLQQVGPRPIAALLANAGRGLGRSFFEQDFRDIRYVIDTNIVGTVYLVQKVGQAMKDRDHGRILITGSIAGLMPGAYQAVYNATKAFLDSFSYGIRAELADSGVSVTCLIPGPTETDFFERADLMDTKVAQMDKDSAEKVARQGFEAMMKGQGAVVTGWQNKLQVLIARLVPPSITAKLHSKLVEPGLQNEHD